MNTEANSTTENHPLPTIDRVDVGSVPDELLDGQWVNWTYVARDGKVTKVPHTPEGRPASHSDPSTWRSWREVFDNAETERWRTGVGRVLSAADPYFMLDLDNCYDYELSLIKPWAQQWVKFAEGYGLYIEVSPSGTGIKIIGRGALPGSGRRKKVHDADGNETGEIELYDRLRFTTITGDIFKPIKTVGEGQDLIDKLLTDVFPPEKATTDPGDWPGSLWTDEEVIELACENEKFRKAWSGDYSDFSDDASGAEFYISWAISRFSRDPHQTERIMRDNETIARPKWDTHPTYLFERTILKSKPADEDFEDKARLITHDSVSSQVSIHALIQGRDDDWKEKEAYLSEKVQNRGNDAQTEKKLSNHHGGTSNGVIGKKISIPSFTTDELNHMAREETPWVIEGIAARGAVTDFFGPAKHGGKTTFITHACAAIIDGLPLVGRSVSKEKILYLTEMAPDNWKDYQHGAGIKSGNGLRTVFKKDAWDVPWDSLIAAAGEMCAQEERGVLVIDTFAEFSGIRGTEENNAGDVHEKLSCLRKVAQQHDLAVILIRHANKEGKGRGSSAFEASVDIVVSYKRPDKATSESTARTIDSVGRWSESNFTTNVELTEDGFTDSGDDQHLQFTKAVRVIKAKSPLGRDKAIERSALVGGIEGISVSTMKRALDWLVEKEELVKIGAGKRGDPHRFYVPTLSNGGAA